MPRKQPLKREKTARISPMVTNAKEQKDMSAEVPASGMSTQGSVVHESTNGRAQAEKKEDARRVTRYPIPDPCQIGIFFNGRRYLTPWKGHPSKTCLFPWK